MSVALVLFRSGPIEVPWRKSYPDRSIGTVSTAYLLVPAPAAWCLDEGTSIGTRTFSRVERDTAYVKLISTGTVGDGNLGYRRGGGSLPAGVA
ncbi:MAG: hypothetical protein JWQ59_230 [Cryobacterium sp.]|nr:hypothetical protein [Cryobacterium sp.]